MVMGGDSGLNGREFESEHGILDVQFHLLLKKRPKIIEIEAGTVHLFVNPFASRVFNSFLVSHTFDTSLYLLIRSSKSIPLMPCQALACGMNHLC